MQVFPTRNLNCELDLAGEALGPRDLSGSTLCSSRTTQSRMPCTTLRRRTRLEAVCFPGAPTALGRALWWDLGWVNQCQEPVRGSLGFSAETCPPEGCFHVGFVAQWGVNNPQPKPQALMPNHDTACFLSVLFLGLKFGVYC